MARPASTSSRPKGRRQPDGLTGRIDMVRAGTGFEMNIAGDGISADDLKRLWPAFLARDSRDWFVKNVVGGRIKRSTMRYNFPVGSLGEPGENKPMPKDAMSIDIVGVGVQIKPLDTMEPITIEGETSSPAATTTSDLWRRRHDADAEGNISIANAGFIIGSNSDTESACTRSRATSRGHSGADRWAKDNQPDALKTGGAADRSRRPRRQGLASALVATIVTDKETNKPRSSTMRSMARLQDLGTHLRSRAIPSADGQLLVLAYAGGVRVGAGGGRRHARGRSDHGDGGALDPRTGHCSPPSGFRRVQEVGRRHLGVPRRAADRSSAQPMQTAASSWPPTSRKAAASPSRTSASTKAAGQGHGQAQIKMTGDAVRSTT